MTKRFCLISLNQLELAWGQFEYLNNSSVFLRAIEGIAEFTAVSDGIASRKERGRKLKCIQDIISKKLSDSEKQVPQPDPDAERLDRVLYELMNLCLEINIIDDVFYVFKYRASCLFLKLRLEKSFEGSNQEIKKIKIKIDIPSFFCISFGASSNHVTSWIDKRQFKDEKDRLKAKSIILADPNKENIIKWIEEQLPLIGEKFLKFKEEIDSGFELLKNYDKNFVVYSKVIFWEKVQNIKSIYLFLISSFQTIEESIELIKRTKDAVGKESIHSPGLAKARENLEKIKETKEEIFENLINSL